MSRTWWSSWAEIASPTDSTHCTTPRLPQAPESPWDLTRKCPGPVLGSSPPARFCFSKNLAQLGQNFRARALNLPRPGCKVMSIEPPF